MTRRACSRSKPAEKQPGLPFKKDDGPVAFGLVEGLVQALGSIGMEKTLTLPSSMVIVLTRSVRV